MIKLTSGQNPKIKYANKLRDRRSRERDGKTLLEGYRELLRAFEFGMKIEQVFFCPEMFLGENESPLLDRLEAAGAELCEVPSHILTKLAYRDRPEGLIAVAQMREHKLENMPFVPGGLYLVAEGVEKPGNLGSILRSADAAGVNGLIICDKCTDLYNPNVIRASTGALFSLPVAEASVEDTVEWLKKNKVKTLAATPHTEFVYTDVDMTCAIALAVGAEQYGLSDYWLDKADFQVKIPMLGLIDSLNVATAATILLYEAARQRQWRKAAL